MWVMLGQVSVIAFFLYFQKQKQWSNLQFRVHLPELCNKGWGRSWRPTTQDQLPWNGLFSVLSFGFYQRGWCKALRATYCSNCIFLRPMYSQDKEVLFKFQTLSYYQVKWRTQRGEVCFINSKRIVCLRGWKHWEVLEYIVTIYMGWHCDRTSSP